jgi:hypothetical protein
MGLPSIYDVHLSVFSQDLGNFVGQRRKTPSGHNLKGVEPDEPWIGVRPFYSFSAQEQDQSLAVIDSLERGLYVVSMASPEWTAATRACVN